MFPQTCKKVWINVCQENLDENKAHTDRELLKYQYGEGGPRSNGFNFKNGQQNEEKMMKIIVETLDFN